MNATATLTLPECGKINAAPFLSVCRTSKPLRWLAKVIADHHHGAARRSEREALIDAMREADALAVTQGWSKRQLAERLQIPARTLERMRAGTVNAAEWLPKLRTALSTINSPAINS